VLELEFARAGFPPSALCWLALGSEGRHEQTLTSDQDNGIVFAEPQDGDAERVRAGLLPVAHRVNHALAACGYPLCRGDVMASNPRYCQSVEEWKRTFSGWLNEGNAQALLDAAIAFDFRPMFGAAYLAQALRRWLAETAPRHALFLRLMAQNALRNQAPLGIIRDFATAEHAGRPGTLDLKLNGIMPFVDAARILSLSAAGLHTNTAERLRAAASAQRVDAAEAEAWVQAFHFLQLLRLRNQQARWNAGEPPDNLLEPDRLNQLDRRILKEAFRQARKLQQRLKLDYQL
jgi:CBS domain-containing protein